MGINKNRLFTEMKLRCLSLLFLLTICASEIYAEKINLRLQHYTTEEGLSQNYVDCVYRDSRGFIWVGTWDGLNRFDGYSFITYRPGTDGKSISDGFINDITEDKNGNLWIATRNGINKFVFKTEEFKHYLKDTNNVNKSISDNWVTSILFDKNNDLWIGTLRTGVEKIKFDDDFNNIDTIQHFNIDFLDNKSITNENIYCLLEDHNGFIYAGSLLGLDRIDPSTGIVSKYTDIQHPFYFPATVVHSLFEDSENILWIGTESGLISIDHYKNKLTKYPVDRVRPPGTNKKALSHGLIKSIDEDKHGKILIGTLGGFHIFDKNTHEFYLFPSDENSLYSLNNKFINDINCDINGNVWIGTEKGGLNKYNVNQKQFYFMANDPDNPNSLNSNIINSIYEDEYNLWIGTAGGGLNRYNKKHKKFSHYKHIPYNKNSISLDFISALAGNKYRNELWVGTWGCGLNQAKLSENSDKITFKTHRYNPIDPDGPPFIYISSILYDNDNNLWIGRPDGLEIYDEKTRKFYVVQEAKTTNNIIKNVGCLYLDKKNVLWIGTTTGLCRMKLHKGKTVKELSEPDSIFFFTNDPNDSLSLTGNFIVSILEDKTGHMWFSTYGSGINRLEKLSEDGKKAEFSHYTPADGLSNNVVYGMLEDKRNNLWLSTDRGLTKYNYIDKKTTIYYESDGIQSNQFYWSAYFKNNKGIMYLGGTNGLNYFNPDSIKDNPILPPVVITDLKLFNQSLKVENNGILTKTISETRVLHLKHDQNFISFEFSSLCYLSPDKNQYKYIMEGFDNDWTYTNAQRRYVTYTNLDPGVYTFKVNATNNDGVWSDKPAYIKIIISPPWWKTIWFSLLFIIFIAAVIISAFLIRVRELNKQKDQLEKLVEERTKELKQLSNELKEQTIELNMSNDNLKIINETKDKLFGIVAHDLKNPFNVMLGMFDLLVKNYDKYSDERKLEMLNIVNSSSQNLYKLLENLLQWSRTQTGTIEFSPEPFILKDIITGNLKLLEEQAKEKNNKLSCECGEEIIVIADINLINSIFRNLLNNAIKFTENGSVTVNVKKDKDKKFVYVHIIDTGVGIEKNKLDDIFNIGSKNSTKGTNGEAGTGLGLILCKEFVEKNGGKIYVESEPGKGSEFIFTIPAEIIISN